MAGPTFCPHSFACWGEIAQRWGCGYCRRRMSVTIQKETLAFYDYCLCVPPLKTEWRELSVQRFWLSVRWLGSSRKGCTDISLLRRRYSDPVPNPEASCPTMAQPGLNGIWGLVCLLAGTRNRVCQVCAGDKGPKLCKTYRFSAELQQPSVWKKCLPVLVACILQLSSRVPV